MRMRLRALLPLLGAVAGLVMLPGAASADGRVVPLSFSGADCGAVATATYRLPSAARLAYASSPVVGDWVGATKADRHSRKEMARVTGVELNEYCHFVLHRPVRRCLSTDRWRG
jgi:hypothetical protein